MIILKCNVSLLTFSNFQNFPTNEPQICNNKDNGFRKMNDSIGFFYRRVRQTTSCTVADNCTCGAHEIASCDNNMCHCHHDGNHHNTGNHNPPHHPWVVLYPSSYTTICKHSNIDVFTCSCFTWPSRRAVFCNNNADCSAHCDPHNGNCINNACHCSHQYVFSFGLSNLFLL